MTPQETDELRELLQRWSERGSELDSNQICSEVRRILSLIRHGMEGETSFRPGCTSTAIITEAMIILPRRPEFDDLAEIHHRDAVADVGDGR